MPANATTTSRDRIEARMWDIVATLLDGSMSGAAWADHLQVGQPLLNVATRAAGLSYDQTTRRYTLDPQSQYAAPRPTSAAALPADIAAALADPDLAELADSDQLAISQLLDEQRHLIETMSSTIGELRRQLADVTIECGTLYERLRAAEAQAASLAATSRHARGRRRRAQLQTSIRRAQEQNQRAQAMLS